MVGHRQAPYPLQHALGVCSRPAVEPAWMGGNHIVRVLAWQDAVLWR